MKDNFRSRDYEVGYGKPPVSGQFKKGSSGNSAGRPKKVFDLDRALIRELESSLTINENGKRRSIKKYEAIAKQIANKAAFGNLPAMRLLLDLQQQSRERAAELQQRSPYDQLSKAVSARDLTDEELAEIIRKGQRKARRSLPSVDSSVDTGSASPESELGE